MGYMVGIDFGMLSGRAVLVRVEDGAEVASAVQPYASSVITPEPDWAQQNPNDYRDVLRHAVPQILTDIDPSEVIGIGVGFTACTVLPTTRDGTPLCELPELRDGQFRPTSGMRDCMNGWLAAGGAPHGDEFGFARRQMARLLPPEQHRVRRGVEPH